MRNAVASEASFAGVPVPWACTQSISLGATPGIIHRQFIGEGVGLTLLSGMLFSLASCGLVTRQGGFHALTPRGLSLHRSSIPSRQAKPTNFGRKSHAVLGDLDISRYIDD